MVAFGTDCVIARQPSVFMPHHATSIKQFLSHGSPDWRKNRSDKKVDQLETQHGVETPETRQICRPVLYENRTAVLISASRFFSTQSVVEGAGHAPVERLLDAADAAVDTELLAGQRQGWPSARTPDIAA